MKIVSRAYRAVHSSPCRLRLVTSNSNFFFIDEFQWFLIELSDLPLKYLAISAHLFPKCWCKMNNKKFSSLVHGFLLIAGLRWLCHLIKQRDSHYFDTQIFTSLDIVSLLDLSILWQLNSIVVHHNHGQVRWLFYLLHQSMVL